MKRFSKFLLIFLVTIFCNFSIFALTEDEEYEAENLVFSINGVSEPKVHDNFIVFTAENKFRHVGIAFDFEDYGTIHDFYRNVFYDIDMKERDSILFYICKIPEKTEKISYRLVIDGVWTTDPYNSQKYYSSQADTYLSYVDIPFNPDKIKTENVEATATSKNSTHFVYKGEPGQKIRLAGTFTNWDSYIYEFKETSSGFYELSLSLPKGTYYYAYYNGRKSFADNTNPNKVYTDDGKVASVLEVN